MESGSNQKSVKQIKLDLRFFKVASHDDSFAHAWHSLNQLHLECISINRCALLICGISFLNAFEPVSCVVTRYGWVGIQKMAQISKEKQQSIINVRHGGQSIWNISFFQMQSQKPSSAMMKLALMRMPQKGKTQTYLCYRGSVHYS